MRLHTIKDKLHNSIDFLTGIFGYKIVKDIPDFILYEFESYEDYRKTQIKWNKEKIDRTWAEPQILDEVVTRLLNSKLDQTLFGICHGSRNGFEQNYLKKFLKGTILGTDISETALNYSNSIIHDFHNEKKEWIGKADFIYSNSLDQSWKPIHALNVWIGQLKIGGLLFIEWSCNHSPIFASKMDPFGVKPEYFAYFLTKNLGHRVSIDVILTKKLNPPMPIWIYEVKRIF